MYVVDTNELESKPRHHCGTCTDAVNRYKIYKYIQFIMHYVIDPNDCESNPCVNCGICYDAMSRYICKCNRGYTGANCETSTSDINTGLKLVILTS